ncbi:hypothetical protein [Thiococcus pfennigii]|uniref:hypothetical protein n=1 Tax=Thiococcus pfennigii TaxID=1057 RepID=UPI001903C88C|nr:hypothetical protein [Thiococcus pfennigii]MBK1700337.1 hypothetical protein [Thiococcus pfennigii]
MTIAARSAPLVLAVNKAVLPNQPLFCAALTIMGRAEPTRMMTCRLAPDRYLTPTLSQRARERRCCANFIVVIAMLVEFPYLTALRRLLLSTRRYSPYREMPVIAAADNWNE